MVYVILLSNLNILYSDLHVASGGNHSANIVERFNVFLNKGFKIFCNEHDTTRVFVEGA